MGLMTSTLSEYLEPILQMIKNLIACEDAYINVNHLDSIVAKDALLNLFKKNNDLPREENAFKKVESNNNIYRNSDNEDEEGEESEEEHEVSLAIKEFFDSFMDTYGVNKIDTKNKESANIKRVNNTIATVSFQMHLFNVGYEADKNIITHIPKIGLINDWKIMEVNDSPVESENFETQITKNCMSSYFNIGRKHITDLVPKIIMAFLISKTKKNFL